MTSYIAKKVGRKVFANQLADQEPIDPHYETFTDARGRTKSRKRAMPSGLSKRDERILRSVRRRAHYLDKGFSLCGFRFGWSAVFGLIPLAGDIFAFLLGYFLVLKKCREADLPLILQQRMAFNSTVSLGVSLIPLVGDLVAAVWKANSRNAALLEDFLIQRAAKNSKGNPSADLAAAESAIHTASIDRVTGERKGAPYAISNEVMAEEGERKVGSEGPKKQKPWKFYGWGKDKGSSEERLAGASGSGGVGSTAVTTPASSSNIMA